MITQKEGREPRTAGVCHFAGSLVYLPLSQNLERNNVATALVFGGSCPPSFSLQVRLDGLVPRLGLRIIEPVSRVPSRLLKPQGAGLFRGAACHRWPAAAATRTWGRVRGAGTRPPASSGWGVPGAGARGSPEQGYKNAARAQESSLDGVAAIQPCREASSSCSSATVRAPSLSPYAACDLPQWPGLRLSVSTLSLAACSLAPAMAMREVTVACSETADLPCPAPWDPQLSYEVSWAKVSKIRV